MINPSRPAPLLSQRAERVLSLAAEEALTEGASSVRTDHMLLALLREGAGPHLELLNTVLPGLDVAGLLRRALQAKRPNVIDGQAERVPDDPFLIEGEVIP